MARPKKKNTTTEYTHEQLHNALLNAQDMLERSQITFITLNDTALQLKQEVPVLNLQRIDLGIQKKYLTDSCFSMLKSLVPNLEEKGLNYYYEFQGVPIQIRIIHRHYKFFDRPDSRFYYLSEFPLPNPFEDYWKARHFVA